MIRNLLLILAVLLAGRVFAADGATLQVFSLDESIPCVRAATITADFGTQVRGQLTNSYPGLVLDLRFASGNASVADKELFTGPKKPIVVLINAQTTGAAANLAMQLRAAGRVIVIGNTNLPLPLHADITVPTSEATERLYQANPFASAGSNQLTTANMNRNFLPYIDHTSEAELVRRRLKDGDEGVEEIQAPRSAPAQPVIRDPALARAVDLIKAVGVLGKFRG